MRHYLGHALLWIIAALGGTEEELAPRRARLPCQRTGAEVAEGVEPPPRAVGPCLTGCVEFPGGYCSVCGWPDGWWEKPPADLCPAQWGGAVKRVKLPRWEIGGIIAALGMGKRRKRGKQSKPKAVKRGASGRRAP